MIRGPAPVLTVASAVAVLALCFAFPAWADEVRGANGALLARVTAQEVRSASVSLVNRLDGRDVRDASGRLTGRVSGVSGRQAALYFFFLQ